MSASSTSPLGAMWRPMLSCRPMKPRVGMVAIGQAPRVDVVPARVGVLRGVSSEGRLGVLTPSERHVEPTTRRWREHKFAPVVVAASPYRHAAPISVVADRLRAGGVGFVVLDCIGFQRSQRDALQAALDVPVIVANLLVARVVAELLST